VGWGFARQSPERAEGGKTKKQGGKAMISLRNNEQDIIATRGKREEAGNFLGDRGE